MKFDYLKAPESRLEQLSEEAEARGLPPSDSVTLLRSKALFLSSLETQADDLPLFRFWTDSLAVLEGEDSELVLDNLAVALYSDQSDYAEILLQGIYSKAISGLAEYLEGKPLLWQQLVTVSRNYEIRPLLSKALKSSISQERLLSFLQHGCSAKQALLILRAIAFFDQKAETSLLLRLADKLGKARGMFLQKAVMVECMLSLISESRIFNAALTVTESFNFSKAATPALHLISVVASNLERKQFSLLELERHARIMSALRSVRAARDHANDCIIRHLRNNPLHYSWFENEIEPQDLIFNLALVRILSRPAKDQLLRRIQFFEGMFQPIYQKAALQLQVRVEPKSGLIVAQQSKIKPLPKSKVQVNQSSVQKAQLTLTSTSIQAGSLKSLPPLTKVSSHHVLSMDSQEHSLHKCSIQDKSTLSRGNSGLLDLSKITRKSRDSRESRQTKILQIRVRSSLQPIRNYDSVAALPPVLKSLDYEGLQEHDYFSLLEFETFCKPALSLLYQNYRSAHGLQPLDRPALIAALKRLLELPLTQRDLHRVLPQVREGISYEQFVNLVELIYSQMTAGKTLMKPLAVYFYPLISRAIGEEIHCPTRYQSRLVFSPSAGHSLSQGSLVAFEILNEVVYQVAGSSMVQKKTVVRPQ